MIFRWRPCSTRRITTVRQPVQEIAGLAVQLILRQISRRSSDEATHKLVEPTLIVRESCAPHQGAQMPIAK